VGFILTLSSYAHLISLATFFVTGSKVTKFRSAEKKKIEADFNEGSERNWLTIICNGGKATQLALLYLLNVGSGERPIDFNKDYRSSWLSIGILGNIQHFKFDSSNIWYFNHKKIFKNILNFKYIVCNLFYRSICMLQWRYLVFRAWYSTRQKRPFSYNHWKKSTER